MKQPHAGVIRAKAQNCVSSPRDLDSVAEHCLAEIVRVCVVVIVVGSFVSSSDAGFWVPGVI
jgi:hypothetical protein